MKIKINFTVVVLGILSIFEMLLTHGSMDGTTLLWLLYGLYKVVN